MSKDNNKSVRDLVAQFVEQIGADSIVVIWSEVGKDLTSSKCVTFGNQFACRAMVKTMHDDYVISEMNARDDGKKRSKE
jgi:hypothetical protein